MHALNYGPRDLRDICSQRSGLLCTKWIKLVSLAMRHQAVYKLLRDEGDNHVEHRARELEQALIEFDAAKDEFRIHFEQTHGPDALDMARFTPESVTRELAIWHEWIPRPHTRGP